MIMKSEGRLRVLFDSGRAADSAEHALRQEKGFGRASMRIERDGQAINIAINADDVVAFRAAMNSLLRNMQVFESIEKDITEKVLK